MFVHNTQKTAFLKGGFLFTAISLNLPPGIQWPQLAQPIIVLHPAEKAGF